jgi:peroxiredoxin
MTSEPPIEPSAPQPPAGSLDASNDEQGRIGYGRYARYTPYALAAVIIAVLLVIAIFQHDSGGSDTGIGQLIGQQAPDFSLSTFDGKTVHLSDYRGSVVVLNFWAEWCEPCKQEMPAFQTIASAAAASGQKLAIVGVNIKNDTVASAQAFAKSLGITYPLGHDVSPGTTIRGLIESSYGMGGQYPATVFIRPNGVIDSVHFGAMTADQMQASIVKAEKGS